MSVQWGSSQTQTNLVIKATCPCGSLVADPFLPWGPCDPLAPPLLVSHTTGWPPRPAAGRVTRTFCPWQALLPCGPCSPEVLVSALEVRSQATAELPS